MLDQDGGGALPIDSAAKEASIIEQGECLQTLMRTLAAQKYKFTTVTPLTHARFLKRTDGIAKGVYDIFGWNLPFKRATIAPFLFDILSQAKLLKRQGDLYKSKVRVSSLDGDLFLHSEYPTDDPQSVFFGPDTYRFVRLIKQTLEIFEAPTNTLKLNPLRILDVGCGSGAGGIVAARSRAENKQAYELNLNDINPIALQYADVCAKAAGISAKILYENFFNINNKQFDLVVSNPPYLSDHAKRAYRDGGEKLGLDLSIRIVKRALQLLAPGGRLILYTGVVLEDADNPLLTQLATQLENPEYQWSYEEIDPDIFGEELEEPAYSGAYRIAAVGLVVKRKEDPASETSS